MFLGLPYEKRSAVQGVTGPAWPTEVGPIMGVIYSFDGTGRDRTPSVPSHEVSGVVAEIRVGVTDLAVGDDIYELIPFTRDGAAAEYVAVPASMLDHAALQPGQRVLVRGGAGGVRVDYRGSRNGVAQLGGLAIARRQAGRVVSADFTAKAA
ncbi:alcohol dehydrogenase catalytic domain-containing protein [Streptomyces sp. NPDC057291]|uniref:alcohol dehydrogenase catalytic domain-containing protein n=1 Tax=Streptomyces sp. NPDC057291 TaxID=3346087 RepID=UPI003639DC7F